MGEKLWKLKIHKSVFNLSIKNEAKYYQRADKVVLILFSSNIEVISHDLSQFPIRLYKIQTILYRLNIK